VKLNRLFHETLSFFETATLASAAGQIRRIGAVPSRCFFADDQKSHFRRCGRHFPERLFFGKRIVRFAIAHSQRNCPKVTAT
jgi:hypothetical protein